MTGDKCQYICKEFQKPDKHDLLNPVMEELFYEKRNCDCHGDFSDVDPQYSLRVTRNEHYVLLFPTINTYIKQSIRRSVCTLITVHSVLLYNMVTKIKKTVKSCRCMLTTHPFPPAYICHVMRCIY
jgi:hypothetical protein